MVAAAIPQNLLITGLKMIILFFVALDNSFYRKQNERKIMKTLVLKRKKLKWVQCLNEENFSW